VDPADRGERHADHAHHGPAGGDVVVEELGARRVPPRCCQIEPDVEAVVQQVDEEIEQGTKDEAVADIGDR